MPPAWFRAEIEGVTAARGVAAAPLRTADARCGATPFAVEECEKEREGVVSLWTRTAEISSSVSRRQSAGPGAKGQSF